MDLISLSFLGRIAFLDLSNMKTAILIIRIHLKVVDDNTIEKGEKGKKQLGEDFGNTLTKQPNGHLV